MTGMIDVLWLPGTFNRHGEGVSDHFAKHLDPNTFRFQYVDYPADYGVRMSYAQSARAGGRNLLDAALASPNPVIVGGYSQGAAAATTLARALSRPGKIIGCVVIADPFRHKDSPTVNANPGGYGVGGGRGVDAIPLLQVAAWGDPITSLPAGNFLRTAADFSEFMSFDVVSWAWSIAEKVVEGKMQPWWKWSNRRDWIDAGRWLGGFITDGRHTDAYIREGLTQLLAEAVNTTHAE